jgi:hypothetical protein
MEDGMIVTRESEELIANLSHCLWSTVNLTCSTLGMNPGLSDEKQTGNSVSYGKA